MTTMMETEVDETLGDLLHRLGDISPSRIRLRPAPGTATVADVVAIENREGRLFELIDGILVEKGMGLHESVLAGAILEALRVYVKPRKLGFVAGADGMVRVLPEQVRIPDVVYISWDSLPGGVLPEGPCPLVAPTLVVEVLSAGNTRLEMERKRAEFFNVGTRQIWEVDPSTRTAAIYRGVQEKTVLDERQILRVEDLLPGFALSLPELFAELDRLTSIQ